MFDNVGRRVDPEARRRVAVSFGMTASLAGLVGFVVGLTLLVGARDAAPAPEPDRPLVLIDDADPAPPGPEDLPLAPAPPPPARGSAAEVDEAVPVVPDVPVDVPPPLAPVVDRMRDASGTADGTGPGEHDGTGTTAGTGDGDGGGGGGGGGGHTVQVLKPAVSRYMHQPRYPEAARAMSLGEQRCIAHVRLSDRGKPESVAVRGCPEVFHDAVVDAMMRSSWYPVRDGRTRVRATTSVSVRFVLR